MCGRGMERHFVLATCREDLMKDMTLMSRFFASIAALILALATASQAMLVRPVQERPLHPSASVFSSDSYSYVIDSDCGAGNCCRNNPIDWL